MFLGKVLQKISEGKRIKEKSFSYMFYVGMYTHSGHEFEQTLGDSEGQGSLACCSLHGVTKSQTQLSD